MVAWLRAWGLVLWLCLVSASPAVAREVSLRDIVVTNSSTDLLLFLRVVDAFSPEIVDGVQNGLAATLNFDIRVNQVRTGWPDKEIYRGRLDHTVTYDTLKKEYHLALPETGVDSTTVSGDDKATALMSELKGVKLLPLATLQPDHQYILKVKVSLAKKTLPTLVHYLLPFGNFWNVATEWYAVPFRY